MTLEEQARKNIAYYRNLKKLSQQELAAKLNMTQNKIARLENLKVKCPVFLDRLDEIACVLGVKVNDFLQDASKLSQEVENDDEIMQKILFELSKYFSGFSLEEVGAERRATCTFYIYKTIFSIKKNSGADYKLAFSKGVFQALIDQGMKEKIIKLEDI
jgi:transcriptional regulator with XRE-family HTH domain